MAYVMIIDYVIIIDFVMIMDYVTRLLWVNIKSNQINKWLILPSKSDQICSGISIIISFSPAIRFGFIWLTYRPEWETCVTAGRQKR